MESQSNHSSITHMSRVPQTNGNKSTGGLCNSRIDYFEKYSSNAPEKSFVQQSIERLYGSEALRSGYRPNKPSSPIHKWDSQEQKEIHTPAHFPKALPSVFRHLRPEFRHQLPLSNGVDTKVTNPSNGTHSRSSYIEKTQFQSVKCKEVEGPVVRHIPIVLEDSKSTICGKKSNSLELNSQISNNSPSKTADLQSKLVSPKLVHKIQSIDIVDGKTHGKLDGKKVKEETVVPSTKVVQDGKYFLKIVEKEVSFLIKEADKIDKDLEENESHITEEVKGKLLAASGKIRLLISKKIKQFRGLCDKNLKNDPSEEFPTTNDDLAGFWDMVSIQVDGVKALVVEINELRENNWKEKMEKPQKSQKIQSQASRPKASKEVSGEQKAKVEARKKATEARRKAMREAIAAKKKQTAHDSGEITIFMAKDT